MKLFARVGIMALMVVCAAMWTGSAWADGRVQLYHVADVATKNGVTDFSKTPEFSRIFFYVHNEGVSIPMGESSGEFTLNFKNGVTIENDRTGKKESKNAGSHTFKLWPRDKGRDKDFSMLGYDTGSEIDFLDGAESALSASTFSYTIIGGAGGSGKVFPPIQSVEYQLANKCVPFIELDFASDNKTVNGVKWRFVDPAMPDTPVRANGMTLSHINIDPFDGDYIIYSFDNSNGIDPWPDDRDLSGYIPIDPILFDDLDEVRLFFINPGGYRVDGDVRVYVYEDWSFEINDDGGDDISGALVSEADITTITKVTEENLTNQPVEIVTLDEENGTGEILTGTRAVSANGRIDAYHTSSVISVKQEVEPGGALAFSHELGFALKDKSLEDVELPKPADFDDLKTKYSVLKYFEEGGAIDLLAAFDEIFSFDDREERVMLNATIIIIDGPAPKNEDGLNTYYDGSYGIKLVNAGSDGKYLYIWDGIQDGVASDPIALAMKDNSNGGGGCNAGLGLFGLLLVGFAALKCRKA
jgi:hypothetical protein